MCVLALAWRADPNWRLVAIANRDERHDRAAAGIARWPGSDVIAGRDLESGGTWLGVSTAGRFAAVTNLRGHGLPDAGAPSRGALVLAALAGEIGGLAAFNPCNLVDGGGGDLWFTANRPAVTRRHLPPGLFAVANAAPEDDWPKTRQLHDDLRRWLAAGDADIAPLFAALRQEVAGDVDATRSIFIRNAVYGTRCSTVVTVDADGAGRIVERRFDAKGAATGETAVAFDWPAGA